MSIYLSFFVITLFFVIFEFDKYFNVISNKLLLLFLCVSLILFAGLRYGISTDYWNYFNRTFKDSANTLRFEPGWMFLVHFYKKYVNTVYSGFIFFIAFITVGLKYLYFRKLRHPYFAFLIYLSLYYLNYEFNGMRQALAMPFVFFAVDYAREKKVVHFVLCIVLGTSVHVSSFFYMPLYFILHDEVELRVSSVVLLFAMALIIRIFLLRIIFNGFTAVLGGNSSIAHYLVYLRIPDFEISQGAIRRFAMILFFIVINRKKTIRNNAFTLSFISFVLYILFMGNESSAHRISSVFDIFFVPLFANMRIRFNLINNATFAILFVLLFITYFVSSSSGEVLPYRTILS